MIMITELPTPQSVELAGWCVCAVTVATGILIVLKLVDRLRGKEPHPPNEQLGASHAALGDRVSRTENSIRNLYARTEAVQNTCTALQTATEMQNTHLSAIEAKLDRLIERRHS